MIKDLDIFCQDLKLQTIWFQVIKIAIMSFIKDKQILGIV